MRRTIFVVLLSFVVLSAWSQQKETRNVGDFNGIAMNISGKVYVTQGNKNEVIVEADGETLEEVITEVRGNRLSISSRSRRSWFSWGDRGTGRVNVYITVRDLREVVVSGAGDVIGQRLIKTDDLRLSISGSGDIELEVDAKTIQSKISGSGNIDLKGSAQEASLGISGSGKYYAESLKADDYNITITGSGRASVAVFGELEVRISGSGSVYYSGQPTGVNTSVSGSGRVRRNN
ncbi:MULTISPECIES: head GIN domain-containing protein [Roseivirga]|nr:MULTISPECIES: head GIN domain-containing protein [Roseivirga]MEC7752653.1 head GIN domain-containing protein [Bacteroidota bacterium]|tara:strand:+ start:2317 stop:3018 length:702 start_codon:yes stop_codon:yes gene_type:complete